jgi:nucleotide-binding universal stress UspA family protein
LARAFSAPVRILETFDPATTVAGSPALASRYVDRLAARTARHHHVAARGTAISGANTSREIRAWSDAHPGSLLVMASHGAGLSEQQLGGVVMDVVRHVRTPVVVVPAHSASRSHTVQTST